MRTRLFEAAAVSIAFVASAATATSSAEPVAPNVKCLSSGGVRYCHNRADQSVFYDTPLNEVAYNVEVIHDGVNYYTVYHSEPKSRPPGSAGDSVRAGISTSYNYSLPRTSYVLWGSRDPHSLSASGAGNPMTVAGLAGDPYFYTFFLGVTSDEHNYRPETWATAIGRIYLLQSRTTDSRSFEVRTERGWMPYSDEASPSAIEDVNGEIIRSNVAMPGAKVQGQIGSISYVDGLYYYFYTDYSADGSAFNLYYRTINNVSTGTWSAATMIKKLANAGALGVGELIRFAKVQNSNRWAALYGCYDQAGKSDACIEYTSNLKVIGSGGISDLSLAIKSEYALGVAGGVTAQVDWLTDKYGNLGTVDGQPATRGGEFYWTNFDPGTCKSRATVGCPIYGGQVFRGGWDVIGMSDGASGTPSDLRDGSSSGGRP
jgi:hypothetical protein